MPKELRERNHQITKDYWLEKPRPSLRVLGLRYGLCAERIRQIMARVQLEARCDPTLAEHLGIATLMAAAAAAYEKLLADPEYVERQRVLGEARGKRYRARCKAEAEEQRKTWGQGPAFAALDDEDSA